MRHALTTEEGSSNSSGQTTAFKSKSQQIHLGMHDNDGTDSIEHLVVMTHRKKLTKLADTYNLINSKQGDILVQATQGPRNPCGVQSKLNRIV